METLQNNDLPDFGEAEKEYDKRTQVWEDNQIAITKAIARLIRQNERWPTKAEVAQESRLSRPTVYAHLKEFKQEDLMGAEMGELKFMSSKILAKLTESAMDGDVRAMRLAFEIMGVLKRTGGLVKAEVPK